MDKLLSKVFVMAAVFFLVFGGVPTSQQVTEDTEQAYLTYDLSGLTFGQVVWAGPHEVTKTLASHSHDKAQISCRTDSSVGVGGGVGAGGANLGGNYDTDLWRCWAAPRNPLHRHVLDGQYNDVVELEDLSQSCLETDEVLEGHIEFTEWRERKGFIRKRWEYYVKAVSSQLDCGSKNR